VPFCSSLAIPHLSIALTQHCPLTISEIFDKYYLDAVLVVSARGPFLGTPWYGSRAASFLINLNTVPTGRTKNMFLDKFQAQYIMNTKKDVIKWLFG
jgi:hypothetical protein